MKGHAGRVVIAASYALLGATLLVSRLVGLGQSLWQDEIIFVNGFLRQGLGHIVAGPDLSHELYGVLTWTTWQVVPDSEIALRLWSAVPFVVGVVAVTLWLHTRLAPLVGLLYLFLATVSPLLLDITRQARGYGLAYFAMSVVIVAALEARRTGRAHWLVAMYAAGVVGTWTLPQFGIAFLAVSLVLLIERDLRRPAVVGFVASVVAVFAWYAPHLRQVQESSQIESGFRIDTTWLLTAPFDHILTPALLWIEGTYVISGVIWLPLVLLVAVVIASSPFLRERGPGLILCTGPVATIVVLWITQAYIVPRYLSYLLVPIFTLMASGAASILGRISTRPAPVRTVVCLVGIVALAAHFAVAAPDVVRLPREANRDAAEVIEGLSPSTTPVLAYLHWPADLEFYLDRPVRALDRSDVVARVCSQRTPVVYVHQPFALREIEVPCLTRPGTEHHRLRQYTRGNEIDVWFIPPAAA